MVNEATKMKKPILAKPNRSKVCSADLNSKNFLWRAKRAHQSESLERETGFEPATFAMATRRSSQLSYSRRALQEVNSDRVKSH